MKEMKIASASVIYNGIFNLKDFYKKIPSFMKDKLGYSFNEDSYYQSTRGDYQEIEFLWTFKRKINEYISFRILVECKVRERKKIKVKEGNKTVSKDSGEIEFNIKGVFILDPDNMWEKNSMLKFLANLKTIGFDVKNFFENVIYLNTIRTYIDMLWEHVFDLDGKVKDFFGIPSFS